MARLRPRLRGGLITLGVDMHLNARIRRTQRRERIMVAHPQRQPHERRPRSLGAGAGQAALFLAGLALAFSVLGLQTGIWAAPAFLPLYAWMAICALTRHTQRPAALTRLQARHRATALLVSAVILWLIWGVWAGPAHAAWQAAEGGVLPGGSSIALPKYPYAKVIGAAPLALILVSAWLLFMAMLALPGHPQVVQSTPRRSEK